VERRVCQARRRAALCSADYFAAHPTADMFITSDCLSHKVGRGLGCPCLLANSMRCKNSLATLSSVCLLPSRRHAVLLSIGRRALSICLPKGTWRLATEASPTCIPCRC
jgi:hypothetical protein